MTWPQSWRKQFAVLFGAIRGIFQNALLPKLCGIPIFIQGMERRTKAGKLKQSYLSKVLFRIFHKNHQVRFLFLINNITGTKESYWMRFFVMMLPLSLVGFFLRKIWNEYRLKLLFCLLKSVLLTCDFNSNYRNYVTVNTNFYLAGKTKLSGDFLWILSPDK